MVHHELASSEYNLRRQDCERAVALLSSRLGGIRALRDVTPERLAEHAALLPETVFRRARHVISENDRVLKAAAALEALIHPGKRGILPFLISRAGGCIGCKNTPSDEQRQPMPAPSGEWRQSSVTGDRMARDSGLTPPAGCASGMINVWLQERNLRAPGGSCCSRYDAIMTRPFWCS
jgi:hypothetical protein